MVSCLFGKFFDLDGKLIDSANLLFGPLLCGGLRRLDFCHRGWNLPGTGAVIATVQDGHKMFSTGRGDEALGLSLTGSIIGGPISVVCLALFRRCSLNWRLNSARANTLPSLSLVLWSLCVRRGESLAKGLLVGGLGIFPTTWGLDELNGTERCTFGICHLHEGLPLVPFLVELFAMSEVLTGAERALQKIALPQASLTVKVPGLKTLERIKDLLFRSSIIETVTGIIPGEGAVARRPNLPQLD